MVLYGLDGMTHRSQAYGLLAVGLREHWDLEQLPSIARGKRGKPLFPDFPQLRFNLSHSGPRALCALDRDEVGVDIQQITLRRSAFLDRLPLPRGAGLAAGAGRRPGGLYPALDPEGELLQIHRSGSDSARLRHPRPPSPADPPFRRLSPLRFRLLHPVLRPRLAGRRLLSCPLRLLHPLAHAGATPSRWKENPPKVKNPLYILEDPCYNNGAH